MKIVVLGLRALPGIAGGVESHCEHLYPLIASAGHDVEVLVRSPYASQAATHSWRGLRIRRLWSPRKSGVEAVVHTFAGVLYAGLKRPDVLHIHSVGPAIFTPLARLLGLRVVVTCHAPDYLQAKWGKLARWLLRTGERMAMRCASEVIAVSHHGADELEKTYGRRPTVIMNGVPRIDRPDSVSVLDDLGLEPGRYVLHVGRAIPDKRQDDLIRAFLMAGLPGWKLVLVGDLSGSDAFSRQVRQLAAGSERVVIAGFRRGAQLRALFTCAGCFALPSAIEGFPIALLEALSAGSAVVASDIPANHEIELPSECYFPVGDIDAMARALSLAPARVSREAWSKLREQVQSACDWPRIAEQTLRVYRNATAPAEPGSGQARDSAGGSAHPRV